LFGDSPLTNITGSTGAKWLALNAIKEPGI